MKDQASTKAPCEQHRPGPAARAAAKMGGRVPVLDTKRLQLRGPRIYDFDAFAAIMMSDRACYMDGPMSREAAWEAFTNYTAGWMLHGHGLWTIDAQTTPSAGFVTLGYEFEDPEVELGVFVTKDTEGHGIAHEALLAARTFAFEALGWHSVVSYVHPDNARCVALMEALGAALDTAAMDTLEDTLVYRHSKGVAK